VDRRALAAAAIALWAGQAAGAEPALGTLFHTPEERARLDRLRRGEPEAAAAPVAGRASAVTGFVKRSDGRHTVWIDGSPYSVRGPQAGPVFDPQSVRAYADRHEESLRIERKAPR
jgi:hypothetical protein